MAEKCESKVGVIDASLDTLVVSIKLVGATAADSLDIAGKVLKDKKVNDAVEKALLAEAQRMAELQRAGKPVGMDEAKAMLKKVGGAIGDPALNAAKRQVEQSKEYKKLKGSLKQLECSFKASPVGVWVDEHKTMLYIVASGLAIGGAVGLYVAKAGDVPAGLAASLAKKKLKSIDLGSAKVGVSHIDFTPSKQQVEVTTFITRDWKVVKVKFEVHAGTKDKKLSAATGKGEVVVPIGGQTALTATGGAGYKRPDAPGAAALNYNLALGVKYEGQVGKGRLTLQALGYVKQEAAFRAVGGEGKASYTLGSGPLKGTSFNLTGKAARIDPVGGPDLKRPQTGGEVKLGVAFSF